MPLLKQSLHNKKRDLTHVMKEFTQGKALRNVVEIIKEV